MDFGGLDADVSHYAGVIDVGVLAVSLTKGILHYKVKQVV